MPAQQICSKPVALTLFLGCANLVCVYNWMEVKQKSWFGLFHPRQHCLYKGGKEAGEHIKLYLKCSDTFQATSAVVSVMFYWSECCVKPINEEQCLWSLSLRAEKAVEVGWESAWLCQQKTKVCNKFQLPLMWLSVMVQNEWNLSSTGRGGEQTNQGREGRALKCLIGFAGLWKSRDFNRVT